MAINERTRHEIHVAFEELWDAERAEAVMSLLPAVEWGEVATKDDLHALEHGLRHELRTEMAELRTEFHRELTAATRTMLFSLTSSVFVVGGLAFAAARLV